MFLLMNPEILENMIFIRLGTLSAWFFHDQSNDITNDLTILESNLASHGWAHHCIHAGPVIRSEYDYKNVSLRDRQYILKTMVQFVRHIDISTVTFCVEKKHIADEVEVTGKLSRQIARFLRDNLAYFMSYDSIKIYYDNGQVQITRILSAVFNAFLDNVTFRKAMPSNYRLFQVADFLCTMKLESLKLENHTLSQSEKYYFESEKTLKKQYLKPIASKRFKKEAHIS